MDCNLETICAVPHHGLTINQGLAWSDEKNVGGVAENEKVYGQTDGRTPCFSNERLKKSNNKNVRK